MAVTPNASYHITDECKKVQSVTPTTLTAWMQRLGFNKVQAAKALGISRSALDGYLSGKYPIPKLVALACAALSYGLPEM